MARRLRFNFSLLIWGFVLLSSLSLSIYLARELIHVGTSRQSPKPHEGTIRIATIDWVGYFPLTAAYAAGYLREELAPFHSDVELIKLLDTGEMSDYVRAGRVHGSFGVLTDYVIMLSMDIPVRMVLVSDFSKTDMLISKKTSRHQRTSSEKPLVSAKSIRLRNTSSCGRLSTTRSTPRV